MNKPSELKKKFELFINVFRREATKLTNDERKHISNLDDFFPSCQLMIIKIGNLPRKHLIVTHDPSQPDLEIDLYEIETWNAITELEKINSYSHWNKEFSEEEKSRLWQVNNYKELIESQLLHILKSMENSLFIKPPEQFNGSKYLLYQRDFVWELYDETQFDPEALALKIIDDAKNQHKAEQKKPIKPDHRDKVKPVTESPQKNVGYGAYIYLPVWLNEYPELSFREKIRGTRASFYIDKKAMTDSYRGATVVVEENGYI